MNNSGILYTPIQINGYTSEDTSNASQLYPRELYITSEGRLIVGNPKADNQKELTNTSELMVDTSLKSKSVEYTSGDYKLDTGTNTIKGFELQSVDIESAKVGTSTISKENNALKLNLGTGEIQNGKISNSDLKGVTLNLKTVSWGKKFPENPSAGDVFIYV